MRRTNPLSNLLFAAALISVADVQGFGQQAGQPGEAAAATETQPPSEAIVIPDEPRTIDPAQFVPEPLGKPVTVEFVETPLSEVAAWIRDELGYPVLLDEQNLREQGMLPSDPVTERLADAPPYLLLNRLQTIGIHWFVEAGILHLTTGEIADDHISTEQYVIGDLLDAGYEEHAIREVIANETSGPWFDLDGIGGSIQILGDVLFVRQRYHVQREVAAVLEALRRHGRMTLLLEPPQNLVLRDKLAINVTADFDRIPLVDAIENLAAQVDADMRIDLTALRDQNLRDRQPVSLQLSGRPLSTTLDVLLSGLDLTYLVQDGVIWITAKVIADERMITAI